MSIDEQALALAQYEAKVRAGMPAERPAVSAEAERLLASWRAGRRGPAFAAFVSAPLDGQPFTDEERTEVEAAKAGRFTKRAP